MNENFRCRPRPAAAHSSGLRNGSPTFAGGTAAGRRAGAVRLGRPLGRRDGRELDRLDRDLLVDTSPGTPGSLSRRSGAGSRTRRCSRRASVHSAFPRRGRPRTRRRRAARTRRMRRWRSRQRAPTRSANDSSDAPWGPRWRGPRYQPRAPRVKVRRSRMLFERRTTSRDPRRGISKLIRTSPPFTP